MSTAMRITNARALTPMRGFRADSDASAPVGTDGLTDSERQGRAEAYRDDFATFSREAYIKAHAMKSRMQKRSHGTKLA